MRIKTWNAIVLIVTISWLVAIVEVPRDSWLSTATLSLACGVAALALMGAAALLGGRWAFIESCFGGLDRVYLVHKWMAVWALGFASVHLAFKAGTPAWEVAAILPLPPEYMRLVRQLSFIALMLIVMLALNRNIRYSVWRWWHKLSGPLFLIVILHWLSIKSPIAIDTPAGLWLAIMSSLAVAAAAYKLLLYPFLSSQAEYRIVTVTPGVAAVHLELTPVKKPLTCAAGQFGFISIKEEGLREPHPFTIASCDPEGRVHFVIRALGDYTQRLTERARPGMQADIYAPHGVFKRLPGSKHEIWIGGGVGISPFIAWLTDEAAAGFERVTLFYFYTPGREFPGTEILQELADKRGARFVPVPQGVRSPEFLQRFQEIVEEAGPKAVNVSFCGPKGLLHHIRSLMRRQGIPEGNLRHEFFEFR